MGSFDDLLPAQATATATAGAFDDLVPAPERAPRREGDNFTDLIPAAQNLTSNQAADFAKRLPAGVQSGTGRTLAGAVRAGDIAATPTFIPFMGGLGPGAETINRLNQQMPAVREEFVRGRPQRLAESTAFQLGREIEQAAAPTFGVDPARDNEFLAQLATAAGEMAPTLAAGAIAGPAGVIAQYGASAGESQAQEAIAAGRPETADVAFLTAAGLGGLTEAALGVPGRLLAIANRARKAGVNPGTFGRWANRNPMAAGIVRAGAEGAVRESAQEALEQAGQNYIASDIAGYAPNRRLSEGVARSAALGAVLGGAFGGGAAGLNQAARNLEASRLRGERSRVRELPDGRTVIVNEETGTTSFPALDPDLDELPGPSSPSPSPATPPMPAAPAATAEAATPGLSLEPLAPSNLPPSSAVAASSATGIQPTPAMQSSPVPAALPTPSGEPPALPTRASFAELPPVPGVPEPLEGQPYEQETLQEQARRMRSERAAMVNAVVTASGTVGAVEMVSVEDPATKLIITPEPASPSQWRVTRIDQAGPVGHNTFDSREAAIRAAGGEHHTKLVEGPAYYRAGEFKVSRVRPLPATLKSDSIRSRVELPPVPGVPEPLEGQPYDTRLATRPEAAMATRTPPPLNLQRQPAVDPELAAAIEAVRAGYQPEVEQAAETSNVQRPTSNAEARAQRASERVSATLASEREELNRLGYTGEAREKLLAALDRKQKAIENAFGSRFVPYKAEEGSLGWRIADTQTGAGNLQGPPVEFDHPELGKTVIGGGIRYRTKGEAATVAAKMDALLAKTPSPSPVAPSSASAKVRGKRGAAAGGAGTITGSNERRGSEMPAEAGSTPAPTEADAPRPPQPAKAKTEAQAQREAAREFDQLVLEWGVPLGWVTRPELMSQAFARTGLDTVSIKAKILQGEELKAARVRAASSFARLNNLDMQDPRDRAKLLPQLKEFLAPRIQEREQSKQFDQKVIQGQRPAEQADDVHLVSAETLRPGDTFTVQGNAFEVEQVFTDESGALTGVQVKDGPKFGVQTVGADQVLHIDYDSLERGEPTEQLPREAAPAFSLAPAESVPEQQARLAQEQAQREAKAQRDKLAERAAKPLTGTTGDLGQGDLLAGPQDLFAPPTPGFITKLDSAIDALKTDPTQLREGVTGLPVWLTKEAARGALIVARAIAVGVLKATNNLRLAVDAGVDYLRGLNLEGFNADEASAALEAAVLADPEANLRANARKQIANEALSQETRDFIRQMAGYDVQTHAGWQQDAERWLALHDNDAERAAAAYWQARNDLPGPVWVALGANIATQLNRLEMQATGAGNITEARRLAGVNGRFRSDWIAASTEAGQTLNAYAMMQTIEQMSPFAWDVFAGRTIEKAGQAQRNRIQPTLSGVQDDFNRINQEGAENVARTPEAQQAARQAVDAAIQREAITPGTPLQQAITSEVIEQLRQAGKLTGVEAEIVRSHFTQNPAPGTLAEKLERAQVKQPKARAAKVESDYTAAVERERANLRKRLAEAWKKGIDPATLGIVDRAIRQRMRDLRLKLGELVRAHWQQRERAGQQLAESLTAESGLASEEATRLADAILRRFKQLVQGKKERALRNLTKSPAQRQLTQPTVAQRLIEASNLGALDNETLWNAVAEKLGLPAYTPEASREVRAMAERLQRMPAGSVQRQKATLRLMNRIARMKGISLGDLGWGFWYANVLNDPRTWAANFGDTGINKAANIAVLVIANPTAARDIARQLPVGFSKGLAEAREVWRTGADLRTHREGDLSAPPLALYDPSQGFLPAVAWLQSFVGRVVLASDVFWQQMGREAKAAVLARMLAREEGLRGKALRERVQDLLNNTTEARAEMDAQLSRERSELVALGEQPDALWEQRRRYQLEEGLRSVELNADAQEWAARGAYNGEPYGFMGAFTKMIELGTQGTARWLEKTGDDVGAKSALTLRRWVIPFTRIPANAWNERLNYVPGVAFGRVALSAVLRKDGVAYLYGRPVKPGDYKELLVKGALSTAATMGLVMAAMRAVDDDDSPWQMHGAGPRNKERRAQLRDTGWVPFSFQFGKRFVSFANTPFASALAMVGNYVDRKRYDDSDLDEAGQEAALAALGAVEVFQQQSYIDAVSRTLGLLDNTSDKTPARVAEVLARGGSSFVVPNFLRTLDTLQDPQRYKPEDIKGALLMGFPYVRRQGLPALNAFGEPVTLNPLARFTSKEKSDVMVQLIRKGVWPTLPAKLEHPTSGREMSNDEHYRYVQLSGQAVKRRLESDPGIQRLLKGNDREALQKAVTAIVKTERAKARKTVGF